jgi:hypothetical protein
MGWAAQESQFDSQKGKEIILFSEVSRLTLRRTQPPVQWVPWGFCAGLWSQYTKPLTPQFLHL